MIIVICITVLCGLLYGTVAKPDHIHLSLSGARSEMNVMWYTTSEEEHSFVKYGRASNSYTNQMEGSSQQVKYGGGFMHHATMIELASSTVYYYRVGNGKEWSEEGEFHTQREMNGRYQDPSDTKVKFIAYGDMGTWPKAQDTIRFLAQREVASGTLDFVLHAGDLAYAFGNFTKWNAWFSWIQAIARFTPYMICTGNRDEPEIVKERFYMPLDKTFSLFKPQEKQNFYYSFDYAFVHVIALSIRDNYTKPSDQLVWLENDLKRAHTRLKDPNDDLEWIVLIGHTPLYSSSNGHTGGNKILRENIEDLLVKYEVSLGLWGDDHCYERTYPIAYGVADDKNIKLRNNIQIFTDPKKPIHLLIGTSGIELDGWQDGSPPSWSAYRELSHGYAKIEAGRETLKGRFTRLDGSIGDEFTIHKSKRFTSNTSFNHLYWAIPLLVGVLFFFTWKRRFSLTSVSASSKIT